MLICVIEALIFIHWVIIIQIIIGSILGRIAHDRILSCQNSNLYIIYDIVPDIDIVVPISTFFFDIFITKTSILTLFFDIDAGKKTSISGTIFQKRQSLPPDIEVNIDVLRRYQRKQTSISGTIFQNDSPCHPISTFLRRYRYRYRCSKIHVQTSVLFLTDIDENAIYQMC